MLTEIHPQFNFGRRSRHLGQFDSFNIDYGDFSSFDFSAPDLSMSLDASAFQPMDLVSNPPPPDMLSTGVSDVSTSMNVDPTFSNPSFDWAGALTKITQAAGQLAPAAISIYKAATAEGQPSSASTPPGYIRNAAGQLVPISSISGAGGMSWPILIALGIGAFFLMKK